MKYVLDSSVAVKWVLAEQDTDKALRLRDAYRQGQHELIAPDWFYLEVMNVLGKAAARKTITVQAAIQNQALILLDAPALHASVPLASTAFQLALQHQRAVYDCLYLALALQEKCELVTADDALVRQLRPVYGCLIALSSFP
jgi:predicted nucleic acid-binding protein